MSWEHPYQKQNLQQSVTLTNIWFKFLACDCYLSFLLYIFLFILMYFFQNLFWNSYSTHRWAILNPKITKYLPFLVISWWYFLSKLEKSSELVKNINIFKGPKNGQCFFYLFSKWPNYISGNKITPKSKISNFSKIKKKFSSILLEISAWARSSWLSCGSGWFWTRFWKAKNHFRLWWWRVCYYKKD